MVTVNVRGVELVAGEFSDIEIGPIYALSARMQEQDYGDLTRLLRECHASLQAVFGAEIDQFWRNGRPILHTRELVGLAVALSTALEEDPNYEPEPATENETEGQESPKSVTPKGFGDLVKERVRNPEEAAIAAKIREQEEIAAQIRQLEARRAALHG